MQATLCRGTFQNPSKINTEKKALKSRKINKKFVNFEIYPSTFYVEDQNYFAHTSSLDDNKMITNLAKSKNGNFGNLPPTFYVEGQILK